MKAFNIFIEGTDFIDIPLRNGSFTWSGFWHYFVSTLIDWFLMTKSVSQVFGFTTSRQLERPTANHFSLLLVGICNWGPTPFDFGISPHKTFTSTGKLLLFSHFESS